MKFILIIFSICLVSFSGCNREEFQSMGNYFPEHKTNLPVKIFDPFGESDLFEALVIEGIEVEFMKRPPKNGGGHFFQLVRQWRDSGKVERLAYVMMHDQYPEADYASPDSIRVTLHTIPVGTLLVDSKRLCVRVKIDPARYRFENGNGGSVGSTSDYIIRNPFYGEYEGVLQYGLKNKEKEQGIPIIISEVVDYWVVLDEVRPKKSEPGDADNPVNAPENPKNQQDD